MNDVGNLRLCEALRIGKSSGMFKLNSVKKINLPYAVFPEDVNATRQTSE